MRCPILILLFVTNKSEQQSESEGIEPKFNVYWCFGGVGAPFGLEPGYYRFAFTIRFRSRLRL